MKLGVVINLSLPAIKLDRKKLNVREPNAGQVVWRLEKCSPTQSNEAVYKVKAPDEDVEWSMKNIKNLHKRLGHASKENSNTALGQLERKNIKDNETESDRSGGSMQ